jgi:pilus assembly protein CpaB
MILRLLLFGLMAIGLLGFGAVAWVSAHPPAETAAVEQQKPATESVLVLAHDVRAGALLRGEDLAAKDMPRASLPADAVADTPEQRHGLVGGMVRRSLANGDVLHGADVMRPGDHGFLAAVLGQGMRAVTVGVDTVTGTAGLIWPGDRVDVILTQSMEDANLPVGRRVVAETVLQNTRVIAIDQTLVQGAQPETPQPQAARTVTLEVTGGEAERVQVAARIGRLSLAVRAADQPAIQPASTPAIWAGDVSHALTGGPAPASVLHVFQGTADGKEFRY